MHQASQLIIHWVVLRWLPCRFVLALLVASLGALSVSAQPPEGMVLIPAQEYEMGDHHDGMSDALPVHTVYVDSFYMDVYEVTNQEYADALNWALGQELIYVSNGYVRGRGGNTNYCSTAVGLSQSYLTWNGSSFGVTAGKENHPMLFVSWYGAAAYANWRSMQDGREPCYNSTTWECNFDASGYRLPTEAEWEYAARGSEHDPYYRYPWGDSIDGSNANYWGSGDPYEAGDIPRTTPAGYYDGNQIPSGSDMANSYGLYDVVGNVEEMCNDYWSSDYYSASPYDNPTGPLPGSGIVVRSGSWALNEGYALGVPLWRRHHEHERQRWVPFVCASCLGGGLQWQRFG